MDQIPSLSTSHPFISLEILKEKLQQRLLIPAAPSANSILAEIRFQSLDSSTAANPDMASTVLQAIGLALRSTIRSQDCMALLSNGSIAVLLEGCPIDKAQDLAHQWIILAERLPNPFAGQEKLQAAVGLISTQVADNSIALLNKAAMAANKASELAGQRVVSQAGREAKFQVGISLGDPPTPTGQSTILRELSPCEPQGRPRYLVEWSTSQNFHPNLWRWVFAVFETSIHAEKAAATGGLLLPLETRHWLDGALADSLLTSLQYHGLSSSQIALIISEETLLSSPARVQPRLHHLRNLGFEIVVRVGQGNLAIWSELHRLPIHGIQLEDRWWRVLEEDNPARSILLAVVAMARTLNLYTIMGSHHTPSAETNNLRQLGIDYWLETQKTPPQVED